MWGAAVVCRLPSLGHDLFAMAPTHDDRPLTVDPPDEVSRKSLIRYTKPARTLSARPCSPKCLSEAGGSLRVLLPLNPPGSQVERAVMNSRLSKFREGHFASIGGLAPPIARDGRLPVARSSCALAERAI